MYSVAIVAGNQEILLYAGGNSIQPGRVGLRWNIRISTPSAFTKVKQISNDSLIYWNNFKYCVLA